MATKTNIKSTIAVYLDNGNVYSYEVLDPHGNKAREHSAAIIATGYRRVENGILEHFPPHRIVKVKATGAAINTQYPDVVSGT